MKNYLFKYAWRLTLLPILLILFGYYFSFYKVLIVGIILLLLLFNFFKVPDIKQVEMNNDLIYSPAYGEIINIKKTENLVTFSIYLNLFSPCVQYYSCDSQIIEQRHINGNQNYTYNLEKSNNNNRIINILSTKHGIIIITQFAGIITQELTSFNQINMNMKQLDELGMFGSRIDITIPNKVMKMLVKKGDKIEPNTILVEYF